MQLNNYAKLKECVSDAEMVLVGLGEEWVLSEEVILSDLLLKNKFLYTLFSYAFQLKEYEILSSVFYAYYEKNYIPEIYKKAYENLYDVLEGKNYFIISLTLDSYLKQAGFKDDRCVNPCGTYDLMQCYAGCTEELIGSEELLKRIDHILVNADTTEIDLDSQSDIICLLDQIKSIILQFTCGKCNERMVFNTLESGRYREEGYLNYWQKYMKWMQGTVNRKLCIIEAGVGMSLPSVIRWPFEKTAFYNQKAMFFRIHKNFYQVNEEIAERSFGCKYDAVQLFFEENVEASL